MKKLVMGILVLSMLAACGKKKEEAKPAEPAKTETAAPAKTEPAKAEPAKTEAAAPAAAEVTVASYKAEIQKIFTDIQEAGKALQTIKPGDMEAAQKTGKEVLEKITPLYQKMADLKAPDSLKAAQEKLKAGAEATLEVTKLGLEAQSNKDQTKAMEIMSKIPDLQKKAQGMQEAIQEINAAN